MSRDEIEELLALDALGMLGPTEQRELAALLHDDPALAREAEEMQRTAELLASLPPQLVRTSARAATHATDAVVRRLENCFAIGALSLSWAGTGRARLCARVPAFPSACNAPWTLTATFATQPLRD